MITKVEAIVLRKMDFRESSRILTLFTREYGTMAVIVKGARRWYSKFGSSLEPMSHISAVIYKKESRELQLLTDAELIDGFPGIQQRFESLFLSLSVIELTAMVTRHQEKNEQLFDLLLETLGAMQSATNSLIRLFYFFEVRLIGILGFSPSLSGCAGCSRSLKLLEDDGENIVYFDHDRGNYQCRKCMPLPVPEQETGIGILRLWEHFAESDVKYVIASGSLDEKPQAALDRLLATYIDVHVPDSRGLRAKRMFDMMQSENGSNNS
jgi:DNA repair protein RecO (recombination protein O)